MMCKLIVDILNFILMPWLLFNIIVSSEYVTPKFLKLRYYYTLYICMFFKIYNSTV